MAKVFIPPLARELTHGTEQIEVDGKNVKKLIISLEEQYPGIRDRLCDGNELKAGLTVAVDGNVSSLGMYQKVEEHSEVHFLPAIGGG